jgi:hypothetical protein
VFSIEESFSTASSGVIYAFGITAVTTDERGLLNGRRFWERRTVFLLFCLGLVLGAHWGVGSFAFSLEDPCC